MKTFLVAAVLAIAAFTAFKLFSEDPAPTVPPPNTSKDVPKEEAAVSSYKYKKPDESEIKKKLDPNQYRVTQQCGTEPPFQNAYWNNHEAGLYVDIVSGEPLFSSRDKFDSGSGWPSFTKPIDKGHVVDKSDESHGMRRVEVRSKVGDSHLGHVFEDGPRKDGGLRYCINSAALRFIPLAKLDEEGYGQYKALVDAANAEKNAKGEKDANTAVKQETAILAGGCFWGMEEILRKVPGVIKTEVGYTGGTTKKPTYEEVCTGLTGHAEAIRIVFDPAKISYAELLEKWFFKMHDPTTKNRQHNDVGTQYRSAIFYTSEAQKQTASEVKDRVDKGGKWKRPIVTEITEASDFASAEAYHQAYLQKHPDGYNCHYIHE